jgi:hypothetical protein
VAASRRKIALVSVAALACLAFAGVVIPRSFRGPSNFATVVEPEFAPAEAASPIATRLRDALTQPGAESPPKHVATLFHWPEELAANKTIEELWKEEELRPLLAEAPPKAPESRPVVSPEEVARARAIVVKGVVVGPKGPTALLSTGRVRLNDVIPGSQFRVASIDAQSVTLTAADERVVLPATASRPGRARLLPR